MLTAVVGSAIHQRSPQNARTNAPLKATSNAMGAMPRPVEIMMWMNALNGATTNTAQQAASTATAFPASLPERSAGSAQNAAQVIASRLGNAHHEAYMGSV